MKIFLKQLWCGMWHMHPESEIQESITWTGHDTIKTRHCPRCLHNWEIR